MNNSNVFRILALVATFVFIPGAINFGCGAEDEAVRMKRFVKAIDYYDPSTRWMIEELIERGDYSVPFLLEDLIYDQGFNSQMNRTAIYVLGEIGPDAYQAVPVLVDLLTHEDEYVIEECIGALAKMGRSSVSALIGATYEFTDECGLPYLAIKALGKIGPDAKEALPRLRELSRSDTAEISEMAEWAIHQIIGR